MQKNYGVLSDPEVRSCEGDGMETEQVRSEVRHEDTTCLAAAVF